MVIIFMKNMELRIIFIGVHLFFLYNLTGIHATKKCYEAKICIHNGIEKCGKDKDGNVRRFIDSCDIKEYNCLQGTEYVRTRLSKCKDLPPLSEEKGVKKPKANNKHGMKLSLSSSSDSDNSQEDENIKLNGDLNYDTEDPDTSSTDLQKNKLQALSSSKDEDSDNKDDEEEDSDNSQADEKNKLNGDLSSDTEDTDISSKYLQEITLYELSSSNDEDSDDKDEDEKDSNNSQADVKIKLNGDLNSDSADTDSSSKDLQKIKLKVLSSSKDKHSDDKDKDEEDSDYSQADENIKLNGALNSDTEDTDTGSKDLQKNKLNAQFASSSSEELDKDSDSSD